MVISRCITFFFLLFLLLFYFSCSFKGSFKTNKKRKFSFVLNSPRYTQTPISKHQQQSPHNTNTPPSHQPLISLVLVAFFFRPLHTPHIHTPFSLLFLPTGPPAPPPLPPPVIQNNFSSQHFPILPSTMTSFLPLFSYLNFFLSNSFLTTTKKNTTPHTNPNIFPFPHFTFSLVG